MGGKKRPVSKKKPTKGHTIQEKKDPRGGGKPYEFDKLEMVWHFRYLDTKGPWGWNSKRIDVEILVNTIHSHLMDFETMTWHELKNGSHNVSVSDLCKDAQKRLEVINQNDIDELFSLRLTGKKRIWGIKDRNILKIIWWDPEHEVCPSLKKHT